MAIPLIVAGIAAAAAIAAAGIGRAVASGKEAEAKKLYDQAVEDYGDEILPHLNKNLEGKLPESAFKNITQSEGRQGLRETYKDLRDVYQNEGTTSADQAAMDLARKETTSRAAQQYAQIQQALAARGQANNPALLASMYSQTGQNELDALSTANMQSQIAARQRALQALGQAGGMAQAMGQQDMEAANAMDRINMFNFDKRQQMRQQDFLDTMAQRDARNAARNKIAEYYMRQGDRDMQTAGQVGSAISSFGSAGAGYLGDMDKIAAMRKNK